MRINKNSMAQALKLSIPVAVSMGLLFGMIIGYIEPEMKVSTTIFSIVGWELLLTPLVYLTAEKQNKQVDFLIEHVSGTHCVLHQESVNMFVNKKLKATGVLFLTQKSLLFFSTEKKKKIFDFEYPFNIITAVEEVPDEVSTLNAITVTTNRCADKISFSVKDRNYWMNQLYAKTNFTES